MRRWLFLILALPALAATNDPIDRAIQQLGAPKHADREQAQQFLWNAGDAAIPALERAVQSPDPEVNQRARSVLNDLKLGIRPDTPPEVRSLLRRFHDATEDEARQAVVAELSSLGEKAIPFIVSLAQSIPTTEQRGNIFGPVLEQIAEAVETLKNQPNPTPEQVSRAQNSLRLYSAIIPEDMSVPQELIPHLDQMGQTKLADEMFAAAFAAQEGLAAKSPDHADVHNNAAWLCAIARRRVDDGLKHALKAVELAPKIPAYLDTLAELYFQKGDRAKAIEIIDKCIALDADTPYFKQQRDRFEKGKPTDSLPNMELHQE